MSAISNTYVNPYGNPQLDKQLAETMSSVQGQMSLFNGTTSSTNSTNSMTREEYLESRGCTDGKNDGKIGFFSAIGNIFKGAAKMVVNTVKDIVTNPAKLLGAVATAALCVVFPPAGLVLAGIGIVSGGAKIASGVANAMGAKTDAEAKAAWQQVGEGGLTVGLSVAGAKASVKSMSSLKSGLADPTTGKISLRKAFSKDTKYTLPDGTELQGFTGFRKALVADAKASPLGQKVSSFVDDVKSGAPAKAQARIQKQSDALQKSIDKVDDNVKSADLDDLQSQKTSLEEQIKNAADDQKADLTKQLSETNKQIREVKNYQAMQKKQANLQRALENTDDIKPTAQDYKAAAKDKLPSRSSSKPSSETIEKLDIDDSIKGELQYKMDINGRITKADIDALNLTQEQIKVLQDAGIAPKNTISFKKMISDGWETYKDTKDFVDNEGNIITPQEALKNPDSISIHRTSTPISEAAGQSFIYEMSKDDSSQEYLQQYYG